MNSPKAVVFDLGKVLLDFDYQIAARNLSPNSNSTPRQILELLLETPLLLDYERGLMSEQAFFEAFSKASGYRGDFREFALHFGDIFAPIPEMIAFHAEISQRGFATYVFSNTNSIAVRYVRAAYPFFANFAGYILSYEHRCMKPDPRLYEVVEQQVGAAGADIFYLDDRLENVQAAMQRGWQALVHKEPGLSRAFAKTLGLIS